MKSIIINGVFIVGASLISCSAFLVDFALGLFVCGSFFVASSLSCAFISQNNRNSKR